LAAKPELLGYYRLLYGLSQKEFYKGGFGKFKSMETNGVLREENEKHLADLCASLAETATSLLKGIQPVSLATIHELQLLTLGSVPWLPERRNRQGSHEASLRSGA
jgi:hypothetical protein